MYATHRSRAVKRLANALVPTKSLFQQVQRCRPAWGQGWDPQPELQTLALEV